MYESYFGLTGLPFQLTPDPSFIFDGKGYREAFAAVQGGLAAGVRVIVLTGEPGVGKTTLRHALLASVDAASTATVHISASGLDAEALSERLCDALGQPRLPDPQADLDALLARLRSGPTATLVVIDEAQHLQRSAFELLETLATGAAAGPSRLQICLFGQPELRILLNAADRSGFRELVGVDRHLGPLEQGEIRLYVEHRLHCAGWRGRPEFEDAAFFEIFVFTAGVPRRVNHLCNSVLLNACLDGQQRIDPAAVSRAAAAMRGDSFPAAMDPLEVDAEVEDTATPAEPSTADWLGAAAAQEPAQEPVGAREGSAEAEPNAPAAVPSEPDPLRWTARPPEHAPRRRRSTVAAAASVAIALAVVAVVVYRQGQRTDPTQAELRDVASRWTPARASSGALADDPGSPARPSSAAAFGVPASGFPAAAPAAPPPDAAAPAPVRAAATATDSPRPPACSAQAFALGLCESEGASTRRK